MSNLPESYLSAIDLPFNRSSLQQQLVLAPPDSDPGTSGYWLGLHRNRLVVDTQGSDPALPTDEGLPAERGPALFIGHWQGAACRLIELTANPTLVDGLSLINFTEDRPQLPIDLLTLAGLGRMILHWEQGNRHCSRCGAPLTRLPGEWGKECRPCQTHHFPHIHPCAIVLVRRGKDVLLTRKAGWAPNRYSLVAGFIEFGENLEEAAAREVAEETGIEIGEIRYLGSQCWPFPSQLMCGFVAEYQGGELNVDRRELEDAAWFPCDRLPALPPKRSIARYILDSQLGLAP
ncbi:MAG: NAD(+) diphosphatase [Desulfuromonas sp.]|nr:MAG: NAD(+) diphosphatase [Desulfuromonas sp.]